MKPRLALLAILVLPSIGLAQQAGDYRSLGSGAWQSATTWERFDGSQWIHPAPSPPTAADGNILIRDTVTVDADVSADQVTVAAGGEMVVALARVLTIPNGQDAADLRVDGTVRCFGTIFAQGAVVFGSGGRYIHSVPSGGGTIPTAEWQAGSTCQIDSVLGTAVPSNITTQSFHHFVWNATRQSGNIGLNFPDGYRFRGDLTIHSSGGGQWRLTNLSGGQIKTVHVDGDVIVDGVSAFLTGTGSSADSLAKVIVRVGGSIVASAGTVGLTNSSNAAGEWFVNGNITIAGGVLTAGGSRGARARILHLTGTSAAVTFASGSSTPVPLTVMIDSGAIVQWNSPWTCSGEMRLNGGRVRTTPSSMITFPAGSILSGGSPVSYIDGPIAATAATAEPTEVRFPIGLGSAYRPVVLRVQHNAATPTTYTVAWMSGPATPRTLPPTLLNVSEKRYLSLAKGSGAGIGAAGASLEVWYGADDSVASASTLRLAKDDGAGAWVNLGGSGSGVPEGSIVSNTFLTFSDFVLAVADTTAAASVPVVTTTVPSRISTTSFVGGGAVTNDGGAAVTSRGVCWTSTGTPTVADAHTSDGTGAGGFVSTVAGLTAGVTYQIRAYATNAAGTGYGPERQVTTLAVLSAPTVETGTTVQVVGTRATVGGSVMSWGGTDVTERGICWNTTGGPTTAGAHTSMGSGGGAFAVQLSGLALGTTYYARAYAANGVGTGYGAEVSFATPAPQPDLNYVVDASGGGTHTTVQAAFNAVPDNYTGTTFILVKKGTYKEKLLLSSLKMNVVLRGEDRDSTILTYDDYSGKTPSIGTSTSYSVAIDASDFVATDITIQNTSTDAQAVALRSNGDRQGFFRCNILGYQDTYYAWGGSAVGRAYFKNCLVRGSVDFIFGRNTVVFDSCTILINRNGGTVTAASTEPTTAFGLVFRECQLTVQPVGFDGNPVTNFYLGRPWQSEPRTVFLGCQEPIELNAAGWLGWNVPPAIYAEYACTGPGYRPAQRVAWSAQLSDSQAAAYSLANIFSRLTSPGFGSDWLPSEPSSLTSVNDQRGPSVPTDVEVVGNYPNPFNPSTVIVFHTVRSGAVRISVHDLLGREIERLLDAEVPAGRHTVEWKADSVSGGVYLVRLDALSAGGSRVSHTLRIMLLR